MVDFNDKDWHMTDPTSRQRGRPQKDKTVSLKKKKISGQMSQIWARHQDILTDWPSVAMWLWLWVGMNMAVYWDVVQQLNRFAASISRINECTNQITNLNLIFGHIQQYPPATSSRQQEMRGVYITDWLCKLNSPHTDSRGTEWTWAPTSTVGTL
jgi:hypothetical protein